MSILTPVLALIIWTLVIWVWMYATRIPAMKKANVNPQTALHAGALSILPTNARVVADNYNHLLEQPVIFYALIFYTHLVGASDPLSIWLAWSYVGLRTAHSFAQIVLKKVMVRFSLFVASTIPLFVIAIRNLVTLIG